MTADAITRQLSESAESRRRLDPDALATLGIDFGQVRRAAEDQFGPGALTQGNRLIPKGHLPFSKHAKKLIELALREAVASDSTSINSAHLLRALIQERSSLAFRLVDSAVTDLDELGIEAGTKAGQQAA